MPNRRLGQARGRQTILECIITAFPTTVNYWEKDGRKLTGSDKYHVQVFDDGAQRIVLYVLVVTALFLRRLQLRFDFDSMGVRRVFDCLLKVIKCTICYGYRTKGGHIIVFVVI